MYPQYNPGSMPWEQDAFTEGVAGFTGPDRFFPGHRARLWQTRQYSGTAVYVLPEVVVRGKRAPLYKGPAYNPLTDVYYPPDRGVNVAPSGGSPPDVPGSERKPGTGQKKAPATPGASAFQDIVKGAWQRG